MSERKHPRRHARRRVDQGGGTRPSSSNPTDRAWAEYSRSFREKIVPHLLSSAVGLVVYEHGPIDDDTIRLATELGLLLLLDKPIVVVIPPGQTAPERLLAIAAHVVEELDPTDEASSGKLAATLQQLAGETP